MGEEFGGPEKLGLAPKVLQNFGVLLNLSATGLLLCETFCRAFLRSAEFWGTFGSPGPVF